VGGSPRVPARAFSTRSGPARVQAVGSTSSTLEARSGGPGTRCRARSSRSACALWTTSRLTRR